MKTRIYVDGRITPPEDAVVPVLDHGFLFGDSVYEVLWWHRGVLIQEKEHLDRLEESAARTYMDLTVGRDALVEAVRETCAAAEVEPHDDAYVRLMVTRGAGPLGLGFRRVPDRAIIVIVAPANRPDAARFAKGITTAIVSRQRNPSQALDPRAKTGNYLNNVLALHEARLEGADDALMLNEAGEITEATTSNVYVVPGDDRLVTPPLAAGILMGTTRARILALAAEHGVDVREETVMPADLVDAREVFISSSVRGILPVTQIDGKRVGSGTAGPLTLRIHAWFEAAADAEAAAAS